jgi:hypothetical protein
MEATLPSVNGRQRHVFRKRFDPAPHTANSPTPIFFLNHMGKQYNKTEKSRRRKDYIKRKKDAAKAARATKPKKKAPAKKKEAAPEAAPAAE